MVDLGYLNEFDFLYLYRGEKYYLLEFYRRGKPRTWEEIFNRVHSFYIYIKKMPLVILNTKRMSVIVIHFWVPTQKMKKNTKNNTYKKIHIRKESKK
jgi:hypothetical protein